MPDTLDPDAAAPAARRDIPRAQAMAARAASWDPDTRSFDVVMSTGVRRKLWGNVYEELVVSDEAVDLDRVARGIVPFVDNHFVWGSVDAGLGVVTAARIQSGALVGRVTLHDTDRARAIGEQIGRGELSAVSIGYQPNYTRIETDTEIVYRAERWELQELSLVLVPADPTAVIRSSVLPTAESLELFTVARMSRAANPEEAGTMPTTETAAAGAAAPPVTTATAAVDEAAVRAAERQRVTAIQAKGARAGVPADVITRAIDEGMTLEQFGAAALDAIATAQERTAISPVRIDVTRDEAVTRRAAMVEALQHRCNPGAVKLDAGRQYRGMRLIELARDALAAEGQQHRALSPFELAQRAIHTTSDFPAILGTTVNRSMRDAYTATQQTFRGWARQVNAPDFRDVRRIALSDHPVLPVVLEGGEAPRLNLSEVAETYRVVKRESIIAITYEAIVNDDLSAFSRLPSMIGAAAARTETEVVYSVLTANANLADGTALFHTSSALRGGDGSTANSGNLNGTNANPTIAAVGAAMQFMMGRVGPGGQVLGIQPRYVVAPQAHMLTLGQTLNQTQVVNGRAEVLPEAMRPLVPIIEPYLRQLSGANHWYLIADPSSIDTVEYAYLDGEEGLQTFERVGFDVSGLEVKARLVFGAGAVDWRGMYRQNAA